MKLQMPTELVQTIYRVVTDKFESSGHDKSNVMEELVNIIAGNSLLDIKNKLGDLDISIPLMCTHIKSDELLESYIQRFNTEFGLIELEMYELL